VCPGKKRGERRGAREEGQEKRSKRRGAREEEQEKRGEGAREEERGVSGSTGVRDVYGGGAVIDAGGEQQPLLALDAVVYGGGIVLVGASDEHIAAHTIVAN
jgi:hypothetical protein